MGHTARTLLKLYYEGFKAGVNMDAPRSFPWSSVDDRHACVRGEMTLTSAMIDRLMSYKRSDAHTDMLRELHKRFADFHICPMQITLLTTGNK